MSSTMAIPTVPVRPHSFFDLPHLSVPLQIPGIERPVRVHCKTVGDGPPLLLIHGLMTSSYSFRYVIRPLAERYRVIVPDLPGAGRSGAPESLAMSPSSVAMVLLELIDSLKLDSPYVVGNSLGGYEALWLAALHPGRIRRLVVMHAPGFPTLKIRLLSLVSRVPGAGALFRRIAAKDPEAYAASKIHYHHPSLLSLEEAREYGSIFRDEAKSAMFVRILKETLSPGAMKTLRCRLEEIRDRRLPFPPTRLFWAREDAMVPPSFGPRFQELLPQAELVWFDRSSHFLQVDAPERTVDEILAFDAE